MTLRLGWLMNLSPEERRARLDAAHAAAMQVVTDLAAEARTPVSFKDCDPWTTPALTVVQHDAGSNWMLVSHDGNPANAKKIPLAYTRGPRAGKPITTIIRTTAEFKAFPPEVGFHLITIQGWAAEKCGLCQAKDPRLSSDIEWTAEQLKAWGDVALAYSRLLDGRRRAQREIIREREARARRAAYRSAGQYTVTEFARGVR
jgi:hypothetical protein